MFLASKNLLCLFDKFIGLLNKFFSIVDLKSNVLSLPMMIWRLFHEKCSFAIFNNSQEN